MSDNSNPQSPTPNLQPLTKKERRQLKREAKQREREAAKLKRGAGRTIKWLGLIAIILIALGGLFSLAQKAATTPTVTQGEPLAEPVMDNEWSLGNPAAAVTLVEYSDFQCPACQSYEPLIKAFLDQAGDQVRFVYRHFPLPMHGQAELAARAAEAAGRQGQFWPMHDLLFERQNIWAGKIGARDLFLGYAASLNLDIDQFAVDLDSAEVKQAVQDDTLSGHGASVNATPTFFLNGQKIKNPGSVEEFLSYVTPATE